MDMICTKCLEPWDWYYVIHDAEPDEFKRRDARIFECPCCKGKKPVLTPQQKQKSEAVAVIADLLGDDIDGAISLMDDLEYMGL